MTTKQRLIPILAAISVAVLLGVTLSSSAAAQPSQIPVDAETVEKGPARLFFWQEGGEPMECEAEDLPDAGGQQADSPAALCQMRPVAPGERDSGPKSETRTIRGDTDPDQSPTASINQSVIFALDTFTDRDEEIVDDPETYNGSQVDWTIQPGTNALRTLFYYDTETACPGQGEFPSDQPVTFHIRFLVGPEDFAQQSNPLDQLTEIATTKTTVCQTSGDSLDPSDAAQATASASLDSPVDVREGEVVVTQISASTQNALTGTQRWRIFFQEQSFQSRISAQTEAVLKGAVWAEDLAGTQLGSFSPQATGEAGYMVPNMALFSPFGRQVVPAEGWITEIRDPGDGADAQFVDLVTDDDSSTTALAMEERRNQRSELGGYKEYAIDKPQNRDQPWHFGLLNTSEIEKGTYSIQASHDSTGRSVATEVAMGAFDFSLEPVPGESRNHLVTDGASSTFLIRLANQADRPDEFSLDTRFDFSPSGQNWNIDLVGIGQTNEERLEAKGKPGSQTLIEVKVTPPDEAQPGDAARFVLEATSDTTSSTKNVSLEAQVTDDVIRDVGAFVLGGEQSVRAGETTTVTVYAWNRGTATDSLSVDVLEDTFDPNNANFDAEVAQGVFDNVEPGAVAGAPIDVTTGNVATGERFNFSVEVSSRNIAGETAQTLVPTVVEADRGFELFGIDRDDTQALDVTRFGRINREVSSVGPSQGGVENTTRRACETDDNNDIDRPDECNDWTNVTYHRFTVKNTGTQAETFNLSMSPEDGRFTRQLGGADECRTIIDERTDAEATGFVKAIQHKNPGDEPQIEELDVAPGETKHFYLRHVYDGETRFDEGFTEADNVCDQEAFRTSVQVSIPGISPKSVDARTIFELENTNTVPDRARSEIALEDRYEDEDTGEFVELPQFQGVEPGNSTTLWFTASMQTGHEDQLEVSMASENRIQDLVDNGWKIRLVARDVSVDRDGPRQITVPADSKLGPGTAGTIAHASGQDYTLGLEVTPPKSGVQENARFGFTVEAHSAEDALERETLGVGIQIGQEFGFRLDTGKTNLIQAHPGDKVAFGLNIENTGATRDVFTVDTTTSPTGLDVTPRPDRLEIAPGFQKVSSIEVNVSEGASPGSPIDITSSVTAERGDQTPITKNKSYTVEVVEQTGPITMKALDGGRASVGPGGQTAVDFEISNSAGSATTVRLLELVAPPGWQTSLTGTDNTTRTIGPGNSTTFSYLVEAPDSIVEGSLYTFMIRAENVADTSEFAVAPAQISSQGDLAVSLVAEEDKKVVDRGDSTTFPILVQNPGTDRTTYQLSATFDSADWDADFIDQNGSVISDRTISVGEKQFNRRIDVEVQAPEDVPKGHVENVTIRAFAVGNQSVSATTSLSAQIHEFGVDVDVTSATTKDAAPGDDVQYEVTIVNEGNGEDKIQLDFEGPEGSTTEFPVTTELDDATTPTLQAGQALRNVTVTVQVDGPGAGPIPTENGIDTIIRATSSGGAGDVPPTASAKINTRLIPYEPIDIDDDNVLEMALDKNRDRSDGFEVFVDQDRNLINRGVVDREQSQISTGLHVLDGDGDERQEHLVDIDADGLADAYFDPDRRKIFTVPYTVDATEDNQPDIPIDGNFDGLIEGLYDPAADEVYETRNEFFVGDGRRSLLVDTDGDTEFDTFVDPHASPPIVTEAEKDGDVYELDTNGDGDTDTHYNAQTQSIEDAETANLQEFTSEYWYVLLAFLAVIVVFGVIVYRRV